MRTIFLFCAFSYDIYGRTMYMFGDQQAYFEPWLQFKHPAIRQLAFSLASPNILKSLPQELIIKHHFNLHSDNIWQKYFQAYLPRLKQLDQQPEPLEHFLRQLKSTRLGLRFEMLIWFWLLDHAYHPYRLLGHSIQIIDGPKTIGELDFLILNTETGKTEHWEVALKYYLAEREPSLASWFGLNRSDTLLRKLNHFTQKQFQFEEVSGHLIQERYAILKGQLYFPLKNWPDSSEPFSTWINFSRRFGGWADYIPQQDYYRLQRQEWLCPDQVQSSNRALWWTQGLYYSDHASPQFFMYRLPPLLKTSNNV